MNYTKDQLANMMENNPDLGVEKSTLTNLNAKSNRVKAKGDRISPIANHDATVSQTKRHAVIRLDYPGGYIAENNCYEGFGKHRHMKTEAREWQSDLIVLVQNCGVKDWRLPLSVRIEGVFKNERERIDVHNLKLVWDGIQKATGLNDKDFYTETIPGVINKAEKPTITITIQEI